MLQEPHAWPFFPSSAILEHGFLRLWVIEHNDAIDLRRFETCHTSNTVGFGGFLAPWETLPDTSGDLDPCRFKGARGSIIGNNAKGQRTKCRRALVILTSL